jgi:hypothetical protein
LPTNTPEKAVKRASEIAAAALREAEELAYDLQVVQNEIAKYRERGLLPLSELNMVKYWDVRTPPFIILTSKSWTYKMYYRRLRESILSCTK